MDNEDLVELFEDGYFPEMILNSFGGVSDTVHTAYEVWLETKRQLVEIGDFVEFSFNFVGYPMSLLNGTVEKKYRNSVLIALSPELSTKKEISSLEKFVVMSVKDVIVLKAAPRNQHRLEEIV